MRALTVCAAPGCPLPSVPGRRGRCHQHSLTYWRYRKQRSRALASARHQCVDCGQPAEHTHHLEYASSGGNDGASNLVALCHDCHAQRHKPRRASGRRGRA